ncbi:MAG TPA: two-component regulator propeller domain-containing protein [Opitutaceae bacterium]|nr:two-component regulator propeller domain-containing protein [Opitutaceae bacterium]
MSLRFTSGIRSIFEDSQGRFWFGSHNEGVSRWDGHEFAYYTVADGLSGNQVRTIQEDAAGNLWFGTDHGISRFDGKSFTTQVGRNQDAWNVALGSTWRKEASDLWFIGGSGKPAAPFDGQGVYRWDGRGMEFLPLPLPVSADAATRGDYRVTAISRGRNGMIWFGTYPEVFGYNGRSFTTLDGRTLGLAAEDEPFHVRSVFEDSRGVLWIGNNGLGVLRYDGRSLSNFTKEHGLALKDKGATESLGRVFSIAEDAAGNLWFGTRDSGVWRYDDERLTQFTPRDGLTNSMVWTIYRDRQDRLWFGLGDGSVYRFNGTSFDKVH